MLLAKLGFALLGLTAGLATADPFMDTWKLNPEEFGTGWPLKEQSATIAEARGDLDVMITGTAADATGIAMHYTMPAQGAHDEIIESRLMSIGKGFGKGAGKGFGKGFGKGVGKGAGKVFGKGAGKGFGKGADKLR